MREKTPREFFPLKHFILDVYDKAVICGKNSRYIEYIKYITPSVNIQSASWFLDTKSTELSEGSVSVSVIIFLFKPSIRMSLFSSPSQ